MMLMWPTALWALVAVPPVLVLLAWRAQRVRQIVPSLMLWERVLAAAERVAGQRLLAVDLSLVLAGLFLCLAILAISGPVWHRRTPLEGRVVVLADNSASMGARGPDGRTRWERAVERCQRVLGRLSGRWRVAVWPFPAAPASLAEWVSREAAATVMARMSPSDVPGDLSEGLRSLLPALPHDSPVGLVLLTDRVPEAMPEEESRPAVVISVGGEAENAGIVAFDVDARSDTVFAVVQNFSWETRTVALTVLADGEPVERREMMLEPRGQRAALVRWPLAGVHLVEAMLEPPDALDADNRVAAVRSAPFVTLVAWVGEPDLLMQTALDSVGATIVTTTAPPDREDYPLIVYNRAPCEGVRIRYAVLVTPQDGAPGIESDGEMERPAPVVVEPGHPLMRHVDLHRVRIERAMRLQVDEAWTPLVTADGLPLIAVRREGQRTLVVLAFHPAESDWPLKASFPIFWHNVVREAVRMEQPAAGFAFWRTGQPVALQAAAERIRLDGPGGLMELDASATGAASFTALRVGVYRREDRPDELYAANLLDAAESDVAVEALPFDAQALAARLEQSRMERVQNKPLRPHLLVAALAALAAYFLAQERRRY